MTEADHPTIRHVLIEGRVQGVGYRAWTQHAALRHGLDGWVRNRADGAVEALFVGPERAVAAVLAECRSGPLGASVDRIREIDAEGDLAEAGALSGFQVRLTV